MTGQDFAGPVLTRRRKKNLRCRFFEMWLWGFYIAFVAVEKLVFEQESQSQNVKVESLL